MECIKIGPVKLTRHRSQGRASRFHLAEFNSAHHGSDRGRAAIPEMGLGSALDSPEAGLTPSGREATFGWHKRDVLGTVTHAFRVLKVRIAHSHFGTARVPKWNCAFLLTLLYFHATIIRDRPDTSRFDPPG